MAHALEPVTAPAEPDATHALGGAAAEPRADAVHAVVIGASAGGFDVLLRLLGQLPPSCRAAVMVVLHIAADRPSQLATIFSTRCALPVQEAQDKQPIEPGTVYFAPPDYHLLVETDHSLSLSMDPPVHFSRPAADVLFESAAAAYGRQLIAIVLSGASVDGSAGLQAAHRAGSRTWVQDPATAAVSTMPASALEAVPSAEILGVDDMARRLCRLTH